MTASAAAVGDTLNSPYNGNLLNTPQVICILLMTWYRSVELRGLEPTLSTHAVCVLQ